MRRRSRPIVRAKRVDNHHGKLKAALADLKTWILAFVYFTIAAGVYMLTFWLPTMMKAFPGVSIAQVGWYVVPPFCLRCAGHPRNHQFVRAGARTALPCCPAYDRRHTLLVCDDLFPITC